MPLSFSYGVLDTPRFSTVAAAFRHHAALRADAIATRDLSTQPPSQITYSELAPRSARLARKLEDLGVVPGHCVPPVTKSGSDMLAGIISVLSSRAQYVPLDGTVSDATLKFVLEQTRAHTVLALRSTRHRLSHIDESNVVGIRDLEHVDVTRQNVTNLVCQSHSDLGIAPGTQVGRVLNISFNTGKYSRVVVTAWEILCCLVNRGTLIPRGLGWRKALQEVDILVCAPSILAKYNPVHYPNIKVVATAGESSPQRLAGPWASHCTYYNCCGLSETIIVNIMHKHQTYQPLSIDAPTPNNNVPILIGDSQPTDIGEIGAMWASGLGVTRGYVGLSEKTAERYVHDPFLNDESKIYNTGDLCSWNVDGSVHILGRGNNIVKVRGFREEFNDAIASTNSCPAVNRAAALLTEGKFHGFLTPKGCDLGKMVDHVKSLQPYYALPTHSHLLDTFPMTVNGKIDKKALKARESLVEKSTPTEWKTSTEVVAFPKPAVISHSRSGSSTSSLTQFSYTSEESEATFVEESIDLEAAFPEKSQKKLVRGLRHRILIVYRLLFTLVGIFNIAAALAVILSGIQREWLSTVPAINLALAVLIRQDFIINALYTITCSIPKSWPLAIRSRCANIYHLGGVHSGAAISAGAWLLASNIGNVVCMTSKCSNWGHQSLAANIISWILLALFFAMFVMAYPSVRKAHHDLFEKTHRFVGWGMLGLFWAQVVLTNNDTKDLSTSLGSTCVKSASFWLLTVTTVSIALSWTFLRKAPVQAEFLSDHAIRLHFDDTVPVNGSFTRLSQHPLLEWHSFATIPAPEPANSRPRGYSLIISNAGDWTKSMIKEERTHIWTRGVPTCGVMRITTLFKRVILIATGSGIGPMLGHIQSPSCPIQLIWSTSRPEQTFGKDLCNVIKAQIPNAVIHDTKRFGRPDLVKMGYNLVQSFKAEAVIIISNEKVTKKVVYGLETRGVLAYGAIWDS
ncbi:hypothetical protein B0J13DRAFT_502980 [Dactylonectria estremocensis]|uniref:AMP-dependent synthetase/ligase domain-containing protein n=1 Tax=Dactylonectria estremocensis TaxID=1079267 RepID=A0A9P9ESE3_9HYPO|nr:hypothetical protein B0J13DRAFT_502980 [Dactylonectria estremocensis]